MRRIMTVWNYEIRSVRRNETNGTTDQQCVQSTLDMKYSALVVKLDASVDVTSDTTNYVSKGRKEIREEK